MPAMATTSRSIEPLRIEPAMCAVVLFGLRRVIGSAPISSFGMIAPLETTGVQSGRIFVPRIHSMLMIRVSIVTTWPYAE